MRSEDAYADWLAVDWGTSRLRVWGMDARGAVVGEKANDHGAAGLAADMFEPALLKAAASWLRPNRATPALVCGMAGARGRWREAPYLPAPCSPFDIAKHACTPPTRDPRLSARILPGISQQSPPDVMRGEETQIAGLISKRPGFSGVVCLAGTHTKWARVEDGVVAGFTTFMSGELFHLLSEASLLRDSVAADEWDEDAFIAAADKTTQSPEKAASALFTIRAEDLLRGLAPAAARARLSGILIGMELAAARDVWSGGAVTIIGEDFLSRQYGLALARRQAQTTTFAAKDMTLAGLTHLYPITLDAEARC